MLLKEQMKVEEAEKVDSLLDMLEDRHNLAQLCGYKTFRHRAVTNSLAETPGNIDKVPSPKLESIAQFPFLHFWWLA